MNTTKITRLLNTVRRFDLAMPIVGSSEFRALCNRLELAQHEVNELRAALIKSQPKGVHLVKNQVRNCSDFSRVSAKRAHVTSNLQRMK